ncbi:MAG: DUF4097 family beta strand repeat protein [Lachnospiraceae bacterium]|nr:DUF4097 family beta strand repeat protein [Lachnospiraceae bacterium]MBO4559221.1 DUF4097 family beta strand repeat protein [Lachnospiraceae bacterium]
MRNSVIIGILGLIAGLILVGIGFVIVRGDWSKFNGKNAASKYEHDEYRCSGRIDELEISERAESVEIKTGNVDHPVIEYWYREDEKDRVVITEKNGKLTFKREEQKIKVSWFSMNFEDTTTVITLPEDYAGPVNVSATSGSIRATDVKSGSDINLSANSGYLTAQNVAGRNISMKANSGTIKLTDSEAEGKVSIENTSGYITVESVVAGGTVTLGNNSGFIKVNDLECGDISVQNTSGGASLAKVTCEGLYAKSSSGSLKFSGVAAKSIEAENTSGGIRLDKVAGDTIKFSCKSGSVNGSINGREDDYSIITSTNSGSSNLTNSRSGEKSLDVTTTSGSIRITFDK